MQMISGFVLALEFFFSFFFLKDFFFKLFRKGIFVCEYLLLIDFRGKQLDHGWHIRQVLNWWMRMRSS